MVYVLVRILLFSSEVYFDPFIITWIYPNISLEKENATHSSVLAWRIPGTVEPGGLLSMGSHRVRYDWSDLAVAAYPSRYVKGSEWNNQV